MRLKRVRIFGFKTFADRTEVNLEGGIIAVVGPNGCGKSNLVDAILWALGESNARHLRAAASQEVIFSGTSRRKPLGFAEVTLLFDNEDGMLPVDTPEVAVTRRLTRGGESDYFINHRSCRQRDVHELLADSGLGRAGYAIVGQKEIDQALAAPPEDRRAWIDEAAGVQRYRLRRSESVKRLEAARDHLVRVDDILRELDSQREPLREEAEVARKYRAATSALRDVETGLLILELSRATHELDLLERHLGASASLVRQETESAESLDRRALEIRHDIEAVERRIEGIRSDLQQASTLMERSIGAVRLGEERLRSLDELEGTLRAGDHVALIAQSEVDLNASHLECASLETALNQARSEVGGAGGEARALAEKLRQVEMRLAEARQIQTRRLKQLAEETHRQERLTLATREAEGIDLDLPAILRARDEANSSVDLAALLVSDLESSLKAAEGAEGDLKREEDALCADARVLLAERAALDGRRRGIETTVSMHEGLAQGSRAILAAAGKGELSSAFIAVGEAIQTSPEYAFALETALGAAVNDLIVESVGAARTAIRFLKEKKLGRATLRPTSMLDLDARLDAAESRDYLVASRIVDCDPAIRPVVEALLGHVLIATDLDAAIEMAAVAPKNARIVTLEGEILDTSGSLSGGELARRPQGLVQRKAELARIETDLSILEAKQSRLEEKRTRIERDREAVVQSRDLAKSALQERRNELSEARDFLQTLNSEIHATERSRERLARELESLAKPRLIEPAVEIDALQADRDRLIDQLANRSADANQAKDRLRQAEERLEQARIRAAGVVRRLDAARHSEIQRLNRVQKLEPERQRIRDEIDRAQADGASTLAKKTGCETALTEAQRVKDELLRECIQTTEESGAARERISAMAETNHKAEIDRARADARRATAAERLLEEYGIGVEEALSKGKLTQVPKDAQSLAQRLRRDIRAMGAVNIGAIEAFERLSLRFEELGAQRDDIVQGMEQIQASIKELDRLTRDRFVSTFDLVQRAFEETFKKLFGGGEGRIFLENSGTLLESGVDIEVTLPGKKRQRPELLSGGERALCAVAFLFALLDVKPPPLVVLDEVDAPLDGRNVERFGDLLREYTDRSQFIVITHNPTTIERAPVWLGVTMQEPGVSTLVPSRLPPLAVVEGESGGHRTELRLSPV